MNTIPKKMSGYAIGQQDFSVLREGSAIYVDKTEYVYKIVNSDSKYYFLARPRRFGKSLFLSTLRYFFEGRRELFKGLYIDSTDWNWEAYPVLRLDLNTDRYAEQGKLGGVLDNLFGRWEREYGVEVIAESYSQRFQNIIETAHEKTGRKVVILVDEYDKPLVGNLNKKDNFEHYRAGLASLYSNFKSSAEHIRLVFLTGVSRFSKLSVFSDLNNLNDITFDNTYADICGITEEELKEYFHDGISRLAQQMSITYEKGLKELKRNYDGYRFAANGSDIYNPWSLLSALSKSNIGNYWNATGLPTLLAESLKNVNADLESMFNRNVREDDLKGLDLLNPDPVALLYQTGYLTIKKFKPRIRKYQLGIPNNEVKEGFYRVLLPYYVETRTGTSNMAVDEIIDGFMEGDPEKAMRAMQTFFAGIDYKMKLDNENNFHNAFFLLTHIIGLDAKTEVHTSDGSIDITIDTDEYLYIIELKYDHSAEEALLQIEEKKYFRPWQTGDREIILIGVAFSSRTRCIEGWKIKQEIS
ncbi:MAG: ATP-binding protein [Muribaculaceae bacterium]|nr:ATP-binding protein [Muribaculaceae bacterium]